MACLNDKPSYDMRILSTTKVPRLHHRSHNEMGHIIQHVVSYDKTLARSIRSMLRKRSKPDKALDAQLGQASWSLPGLVVGGNMLYIQ
jgi:hypothetical protein